jgi:hypothetical protein
LVINKKLNAVKEKVEVKNIKYKNSCLIINLNSEEQQKRVIDDFGKDVSIIVSKPKQRMPSILIKNIQRIEVSEDNSGQVGHESYIREELSKNLNISADGIVIKKIIDNPKFKSIRTIVNLDTESTTSLLNNGYVKIGYMRCEVEKTSNVFQCRRCLKFGHFEFNKDKTVACRSEHKICPLCAGHHDIDGCLIKGNRKAKLNCANCNGNHSAFSGKCSKRLETLNKILGNLIC